LEPQVLDLIGERAVVFGQLADLVLLLEVGVFETVLVAHLLLEVLFVVLSQPHQFLFGPECDCAALLDVVHALEGVCTHVEEFADDTHVSQPESQELVLELFFVHQHAVVEAGKGLVPLADLNH